MMMMMMMMITMMMRMTKMEGKIDAFQTGLLWSSALMQTCPAIAPRQTIEGPLQMELHRMVT